MWAQNTIFGEVMVIFVKCWNFYKIGRTPAKTGPISNLKPPLES